MMQWWSVSIVAICLLFSVLALISSAYALRKAERPRLIALERAVADYRIETEALANSYDGLRETLKRINSRYAMRELRAKGKKNAGQGDLDLPDPSTDPEAWREAIQRKYPRGVFSINGSGNGR